MSKIKIEIKAEVLRTLHRIHRQLTDLRSQIDRGPRQIKAGEGMIVKAASDRDVAKEAVKQATLASDEKQLQLKTREMNIEALAAKLNTAASNREFSTLKEQIAADQQANSVLSDEIFEALEHLDVLQEAVNQAEAELKKQEQEQTARIAEVEAKQITLKSELDRVESELLEAEKGIPASVMGDYRRLIGARGEEALAPVDANSCGGCYQTLTTQYIEELRMSNLVRCSNCDAFLYMPEDRSVT
ncbi:MAG: zinc ribbon domain-containing protein [Rubripirellula sp.]